MREVNFFKSVKFKLTLALVVIGYLFSLMFFIGQYWFNQGEVRQNPRLLKHWFDSHIEQPIQNHLSSDQPLANNELYEQLQDIVEKKQFIITKLQESDFDIQINSLAVINLQSELVFQLGSNHYQKGDVGAQLPIQSRDDLSDKLIGHFNSGVERIEGLNYIYIESLKDNEQNVVGAVIFHQTWRKNLFKNELVHQFLETELLNYLLFSFIPLLYILPCGLVIILFSSYHLQQKLKHLYEIISFWAQGKFDKKITIVSHDEIGISFQRLNNMSENLANVIAENRVLAGVQERQQLAVELHDTVKQQLFANNLLLASTKQLLNSDIAQAKLLLDNTIDQNQKIFTSINHLIEALYQVKNEGDFADVIKQEATLWQHKTLVNVDIDINIKQDCLLTEEIKSLLLRGMKEALQNTFKHAKAKNVVITLHSTEQEILLKVSDDGELDKAVILGQGLELLKQQVESFQGGFSIVSFGFESETDIKIKGVELTLCFLSPS
ncbi:MAG: hypothetical protein GY928_19580 [Colwellia sp.]|nr:hypothetical protein [Colwellia sp.]